VFAEPGVGCCATAVCFLSLSVPRLFVPLNKSQGKGKGSDYDGVWILLSSRLCLCYYPSRYLREECLPYKFGQCGLAAWICRVAAYHHQSTYWYAHPSMHTWLHHRPAIMCRYWDDQRNGVVILRHAACSSCGLMVRCPSPSCRKKCYIQIGANLEDPAEWQGLTTKISDFDKNSINENHALCEISIAVHCPARSADQQVQVTFSDCFCIQFLWLSTSN
jgi:hypothetical protein